MNSALSYDAGETYEAKRISINLWILLYKSGDGGKPLFKIFYNEFKNYKIKSLYLSEKDFINYRNEYIQKNNCTVPKINKLIRDTTPKIRIDIETGKNVPIYGPFEKELSIDEWLNMEIITIKSRSIKLSRLEIIRAVRDTDGGAHVDTKIFKPKDLNNMTAAKFRILNYLKSKIPSSLGFIEEHEVRIVNQGPMDPRSPTIAWQRVVQPFATFPSSDSDLIPFLRTPNLINLALGKRRLYGYQIKEAQSGI